MDYFNENDRRDRLMTLHTLKGACAMHRGMSEDQLAWFRIRQRIYQRQITILTNWKQFSIHEQREYAQELSAHEND
jgi:hypothetical protein